MDNIQHLLYEDDNGEAVGLREVQLLDPPPLSRVPALHNLLNHKDLIVVFDAALVLAAWGDKLGLDKLEEFIDSRIDELIELAPHPIEDYDNVYDVIAETVDLYGLSRQDPDRQVELYRKLLKLYGVCRFRGDLKYALLDSDFRELLPWVKEAIGRALVHDEEYLASQLLPVLAKWDADEAERQLPRFIAMPTQTPDPACNVAEALGWINTPQSRRKLEDLLEHPDFAVVEEAELSIKRLDGKAV